NLPVVDVTFSSPLKNEPFGEAQLDPPQTISKRNGMSIGLWPPTVTTASQIPLMPCAPRAGDCAPTGIETSAATAAASTNVVLVFIRCSTKAKSPEASCRPGLSRRRSGSGPCAFQPLNLVDRARERPESFPAGQHEHRRQPRDVIALYLAPGRTPVSSATRQC